jgi:hypothetical protein
LGAGLQTQPIGQADLNQLIVAKKADLFHPAWTKRVGL